MDTACHTFFGIETDVVLHRTEVRKSQSCHLCSLPVFLEPATVVSVNRQVKYQQTRNIGLGDLEFLFKFQ